MLNQAAKESNDDRGARLRLQHPSDAADLRRHFQSGLRFVYEGAFGQQLERASLYSFGGYSCKECGGTGFVATRAKPWQKLLRNATEQQRAMYGLVLGVAPTDPLLEPPLADRVCGKCKGMGWIERKRRASARAPLTVQLKGSSKKGRPPPSVRLSDDELKRTGAMESRLAQLDSWEHMVLEDYYSPGGSVVALMAYTPAGRTLLRRNKLDLPARQFFANELAAEAEKSEPRRRDLLAAAEEQAVEVHRRAVAAWVTTKRRVDPAATRRAALELLDGSG